MQDMPRNFVARLAKCSPKIEDYTVIYGARVVIVREKRSNWSRLNTVKY
jgi:hypothetical protein